jgi:hypothetical protein
MLELAKRCPNLAKTLSVAEKRFKLRFDLVLDMFLDPESAPVAVLGRHAIFDGKTPYGVCLAELRKKFLQATHDRVNAALSDWEIPRKRYFMASRGITSDMLIRAATVLEVGYTLADILDRYVSQAALTILLADEIIARVRQFVLSLVLWVELELQVDPERTLKHTKRDIELLDMLATAACLEDFIKWDCVHIGYLMVHDHETRKMINDVKVPSYVRPSGKWSFPFLGKTLRRFDHGDRVRRSTIGWSLTQLKRGMSPLEECLVVASLRDFKERMSTVPVKYSVPCQGCLYLWQKLKIESVCCPHARLYTALCDVISTLPDEDRQHVMPMPSGSATNLVSRSKGGSICEIEEVLTDQCNNMDVVYNNSARVIPFAVLDTRPELCSHTFRRMVCRPATLPHQSISELSPALDGGCWLLDWLEHSEQIDDWMIVDYEECDVCDSLESESYVNTFQDRLATEYPMAFGGLWLSDFYKPDYQFNDFEIVFETYQYCEADMTVVNCYGPTQTLGQSGMYLGWNYNPYDYWVNAVQMNVEQRVAYNIPVHASSSTVLEPCKTRLITKSDGILQTYGVEMQRVMQRSIAKTHWGHLVGKTVDAGDFKFRRVYFKYSDPYGVCTTIPGHYIVNIDFKASTDYINIHWTLMAWHLMCRRFKFSRWEEQLGELLLTGNVITTDIDEFVQRNGQLMGCVLSFPLLCVINAACIHAALDDPRPETDYLVNGDDGSTIFQQHEYTCWGKNVSMVNLLPSPGKNYVTTLFANMNSQMFVPYRDYCGEVKWYYTPFVNVGALQGLSRVQTRAGDRNAPILGKDRSTSIGTLAKWCTMGYSGSRFESLLTCFIELNKQNFRKDVDWFLPEFLGGIGLPIQTMILVDGRLQHQPWYAKVTNPLSRALVTWYGRQQPTKQLKILDDLHRDIEKAPRPPWIERTLREQALCATVLTKDVDDEAPSSSQPYLFAGQHTEPGESSAKHWLDTPSPVVLRLKPKYTQYQRYCRTACKSFGNSTIIPCQDEPQAVYRSVQSAVPKNECVRNLHVAFGWDRDYVPELRSHLVSRCETIDTYFTPALFERGTYAFKHNSHNCA